MAYDPVERTDIENTGTQAGLTVTPLGQTTDQGVFKILQGGATILEAKMETLKPRWANRWKQFFE